MILNYSINYKSNKQIFKKILNQDQKMFNKNLNNI